MSEPAARAAHWRPPHVTDRQLDAVVAAIKIALGDNVEAIYLYGSAVSGGLQADSDLDLFVVLRRPTTAAERAALVQTLTPLSAKRARPPGWRPLEVTAAVASTLDPLSDPPVTDFQFGEWLRERMDAGLTVPEDSHNPDLTLLVAMVRQRGRPLHGAEPERLIAQVEQYRLRQALFAVVPSLLEDIDTDTANVLLTLARVAYTMATGEFVSKDAAAAWALPRLSDHSRPALERARGIYLAVRADTWDGSEAAVAAHELHGLIRAATA